MQAEVDGLGAGGQVEALPASLCKGNLRLCQMAKMRRARRMPLRVLKSATVVNVSGTLVCDRNPPGCDFFQKAGKCCNRQDARRGASWRDRLCLRMVALVSRFSSSSLTRLSVRKSKTRISSPTSSARCWWLLLRGLSLSSTLDGDAKSVWVAFESYRGLTQLPARPRSAGRP
jgi:hypothetical protein